MKGIIISIFKTLYNTDVPYYISLEKCFSRIKEGKSKEKVIAIRAGDKEVKKQLPAIVFAGEFTERNKKGLKQHSGLMVVDFDKYPSNEILKSELVKLKKNKHFVCVFISPSGNGIKGVVKIPVCDALSHEKYFKAFQEKFNFDYFDIANCNVDRVCFESYDPNIYINYDAEIFEPKLIDKGFNISERVPLLPLNDEGKIIELISNFKWSKSFTEGQRNNFILDVAGALCEYGVMESSATAYLGSYVGDGFSQRELENTVKNAFRLRTANSKFFENNTAIKSIKTDLGRGKSFVKEKHKIDNATFEKISDSFVSDNFWSISDKGKVSIEPLKYKLFLERSGFKKHFPSDASAPSIVFIQSNKVEDVVVEKIKDFVLDWLSERSEFDVWNYCANYATLFSEVYLSMLDTIDLLMLKDKRDKSFIAFQNGILEVKKDSVKLVDYIDVDGYVWKKQIIKRDYIFSENTDNDFKSFVNNVSNKEPLALECVAGYLLSTYKNKMNNKAIILNDEDMSETPEGGTGKGLYMQGIKQIRRTAILDGKSFDEKKSFPYQTISQDTNILVFDDVKKGFNFEAKFSLVTEGITLERKNKDAIKLTVEESPKLVMSTNYALKGEGNSHNRRRHEVEFSQYYGAELTPATEFGRQMFDDWQKKDWVGFDNYMVFCLQSYMKLGLVKQNAKNIKLRKLVAESALEFYEWMEENKTVTNNQKNKAQFFDDFVNDYQDFNRFLSRKKFNVWIQKYAKFKGYEYEDGNSNGNRWFILKNLIDIFEEETQIF